MELRPVQRKSLYRGQVARLVDDGQVSLIYQNFTDKVDTLLRAGGNEDTLGRDIEPSLSL